MTTRKRDRPALVKGRLEPIADHAAWTEWPDGMSENLLVLLPAADPGVEVQILKVEKILAKVRAVKEPKINLRVDHRSGRCAQLMGVHRGRS